MATSTFYPSADGPVRYYNGTGTWSSIRGQSSGTDAYPTTNPSSVVYSDNSLPLILRGFWMFDTSSLPDGASITAAKLKLYGSSAAVGSGSVEIVQGSQASPVTTADYSSVGGTSFGSINLASWNGSGYNEITLNSSGLAAISTTGTTKLAARHSSDLNNSAPGSQQSCAAYYYEETGTSKDPVLEVTWHLGATSGDTWAWGDSADVTGIGGGTIRNQSRTTGDTWAWADTTAKPSTARTAGTERTVWAGGTIGTVGAHYAFPFVVAAGGNGRLVAVARKATSHTAFDGSLVAKVSTDDGNSWGAEYTILDNATTGYDERDPGLVKLASGRLCLTNGKRQDTSGFAISGQPKFYYSDDDGLTWSAGVSIPTGLYGGTANTKYGLIYGSDIVELHNGDLLCVGYGSKSSANNTQFDIFCAKSTDGGASWTNIGYPVTYGSHSANAVEPQIAILGTGKLVMTYHVENGPPQDGYVITSTDSGVTWSAPTLITTTSNRHGLSVMDDGQTILISYVTSYGARKFSYIESRDYGASWLSAVEIGDMTASSLYGLWAMSASLAGIGNQQNVGFIYNGENAGQTQASVFYKQFSGMDGVFVYQRAASDTWVWTDTAARSAATRTRSTSDSWAWAGTAAAPAAAGRATSDTWGWAGAASGSVVPAGASRSTGDTWGWASPAAATRSTAGASGDTWTWSTPDVPASVTEGTSIVIHPQGMVPGTAIGAYLRWEWRGPVAAKLNAGPGAVVQETTVGADLTVSFTLSPGEYVAYAPAYPTKRLFFMVTG